MSFYEVNRHIAATHYNSQDFIQNTAAKAIKSFAAGKCLLDVLEENAKNSDKPIDGTSLELIGILSSVLTLLSNLGNYAETTEKRDALLKVRGGFQNTINMNK